MEYKTAATILIKLLKKRSLGVKEKEAILTGIGVLDWANLGKNRMKRTIEAKKAKRDKSIEW